MQNPGWVDLQVNGQIGVDFSAPTLSSDDFRRAADAILNSGTAMFLPTVITSSAELYKRNLPIIAECIEKAGLSKYIPGIHLEGPFLAPAPGYIGCHNPEWTQNACCQNFDALFNAAAGKIKILTIAAADDNEEFIKYVTAHGVAVSLGHHNATPENLNISAKAGAVALTHLGNGIPNFLPRHANPIFAGLANDRLSAMAITDGHHLPPEVIKCFIRCKGIEKFIAVSDGSPAAGLPPGRYNVLGNNAILEPSGRLYNPEKQCLVGSGSTMSECMEFLESLELLTVDELKMAGRMNPLKIIGMENI